MNLGDGDKVQELKIEVPFPQSKDRQEEQKVKRKWGLITGYQELKCRTSDF